MGKVVNNKKHTKKQKNIKNILPIPVWAKWLIGYFAIVFCAGMLVYYWRFIFNLDAVPALGFTFYAVFIFSILFLAFFLICRYCKDDICLKAFFILFAVGLLFCFASAPLQVPDESKHFLRAYSISTGKFNYDYNREYPEDVTALINTFGNKALNHRITKDNAQLIPSFINEYKEIIQSGNFATVNETEPLMKVVLPFLPQALFIFFARLFGFGALGQMYAGRMGALLVYCLICYRTFKNCDKYRGVFIAVAFLPISLLLGASNSYDSVMLACTYFILSIFCKNEVKNKDIILTALAIALVSYIKINNIVLVFIILLIPKERWKSKWNPWAVFGIILASGLIFAKGMEYIDANLLSHNYPAKEDLPRGVGEGASVEKQLKSVVSKPQLFAFTALLTLIEESFFLFKLGTMGNMDLEIGFISAISVTSLFTASALGIQQKEDTKPGGAIGLFLMALLYAGSVMLGIYVLDSHYLSIRITGLQPRYFLPAFLLIFMLASILLGKTVKPKLDLNAQSGIKIQQISLYVSAIVAFVSMLLVFRSYFIGQWVPQGVGGWRLVNIFGWQ